MMISIVIPLYNKHESIGRTINSILSQNYNDFEILVVDDGSTDKSVRVVANIKSERIRLFQKENGGPSSARNYGVQKSCGQWVVFMDADDTFEDGALLVLHNLIVDHKGFDFFCCNHYVENKNGKYLYSSRYKEGLVRNPFMDWCTGTFMPRAGAAIFTRELLITHPFDESLLRYEDAESLFSIMRDVNIYRSPIPIMTYNCNMAEASRPCKDVKNDFIGHLSLKGKSFWEQYALYQLYLQGCKIYPKDMNQLYGTQFNKFKFKVVSRFMSYSKKGGLLAVFKHYFKKIFGRI